MRWWWCVLVVVFCVGIAGAQGVTPAAKKAAAAHRKKAKGLIAKKQIDLAIKELELSVEQVPDPEALFELGQLYEGLPDEAKALVAYQRVTDGKRAADARARVTALEAARTQREAEAKAKADEEAKRKAEEEERRKADEAAEQARKADEERRRIEAADRQQRSAEAATLEQATRKLAEERLQHGASGAGRARWELDRTKRQQRKKLGMRYLKIGIACGAVAGIAAGIGAYANASVEDGGFATAGDISRTIKIGRISNYVAYGFAVPAVLGIGVGVPLVVLGRDRGELRVSAIASDSVHGIALSGSWR
jgi:hypothetical protein